MLNETDTGGVKGGAQISGVREKAEDTWRGKEHARKGRIGLNALSRR